MALRRSTTAIRHFLASEAAGGYILMASAALALLVSNSSLSGQYARALHLELGGMSALHWINDGLMALFFLLIGLEVKRELIDGEMSTWSSRLLPGTAALGGMVVPALVFLAINASTVENLSGWAVPAATDIAFALGVLALLGPRVPTSLKLLLTAIAIIDDLGAIVIIAIAYTDRVDLQELGFAIAGVGALATLNRFNVKLLWPYLLIGVFVWYELLLSGVHATLAGFAVAMTIPMNRGNEAHEFGDSPLIRLEHALAPPVAFVIVPIFGFANAGVNLRAVGFGNLFDPLPLGIIAGLALGKQVGVFGAIAAMVGSGLAKPPSGASWRQIWGLSVLCGIGFTMSLFIAALAFGEGSARNDMAKLGIIAGSGLAALGGYAILATARPPALRRSTTGDQ